MFEKFDVFFDKDNRCYQIRTKTESYIIEFDDQEKSSIFNSLVSLVNENNSIQKAFNTLIKEYKKAKVVNVLNTLNDFGLLAPEISNEIIAVTSNYSENKTTKETKTKESNNSYTNDIQVLADIKLLIIGNSELAEAIYKDFENKQFNDCKYVSTDTYSRFSLEEMIAAIEQFDFIILESTSWNPLVTELLNKAALKANKPWIYVAGIEEYHLKIGPLFYGNETGCYSCLVKRIKSNHRYAEYLNSYENYLKESLKSSKPDTFIYSDTYHNIIISYLYLEISKFFEMWAVPLTWRGYISISAVDFSLEKHDLLKVPFCEDCKPQLEYNPAPWLEPITLKS